MKRYLFYFTAICLITACGVPKPMYYWGDYNKAVYVIKKNKRSHPKKT